MRWAGLPIAVLVAGMLALWAANVRQSFDPPWLLFILNFLFSTLASVVIALLVSRTFLCGGQPGFLLLNCGVVFWGLAGVTAAAVGGTNFNASLTIHNACAWMAALCHLTGVGLVNRAGVAARWRAWWLLAGFVMPAGVVAFIAQAAVAGWTPVFFVQGEGGTLFRHLVLGSTVAMFVLSAIVLRPGHGAGPSFARWYALALLAFAAGMFGVMIQSVHGSALGWTARGTMWFGGLYLLAAAVSAARVSPARHISLSVSPDQQWLGYALAVTFVTAAVVGRLVFLQILGQRAATLTLFPAVILAALYGGRGPGLLAAGLSALAVNYFWIEPVGRFSSGQPTDWIMLAIFLAASAVISWTADALLKSRARVAAMEAEARLTEDLRASHSRIAADLCALSKLQELSVQLVPEGELKPLLQAILAAASDLTGTDKGNIQIYDAATRTLRILVHQGLGARLVGHFAEAGRVATCAQAASRTERVMVEDIQKLDHLRGTVEFEIILEEGIRSIQSTPLVSRDGRLLGMLNNHYRDPGRIEDQKLRYVDVLARLAADLIERKEAGEALRRSGEQLALVSNSVPALISYVDTDGIYRLCNCAYTEWFGLPCDQMVGRSMREVLGEAAWRTIGPRVRAALAGETVDCEIEAEFARGGARWIHAVYTPHRDEHGKVLGLVTLVSDCTRRKQAEETQARYIRMVDSGFDAIILRDAQDRILSWNHGATEMYGWTPEEALGQITHSFFQTKHPAPLDQILADLTRTGRWEGELVHTSKYGAALTVFSRWTLERNADGTTHSVLETNMNITERKRAEEALHEARRRLLLHAADLEQKVDERTAKLRDLSKDSERRL